MAKLSTLVDVVGGFKPSVHLPDDFFKPEVNEQFVSGFYPTTETLDYFHNIAQSLRYGATDRVRLFTGTFGTGKSDLMLMVANYVTKHSNEPIFTNFYERLRALDAEKAGVVAKARRGPDKPHYLLVLLQADIVPTFRSFVIHGLEESLRRANLSHLLEKTIYQAALEKIELWEKEHPDFVQKLQARLAQTGEDLVSFKAELRGARADDALDRFRQWHQEITSAPFMASGAIQRPHEAFDAVAKQLPKEGYAGIFIIIDEMTELMNKMANSFATDQVKGIDNLAELAVRSESGSDVHFYMVSLESFTAAQGADRQGMIALEKSGGRIVKQHALQSANTEELIASAIVKKNKETERFRSVQRDALLEIAMKLWDGKKGPWLNRWVIDGAFPLHPLTLYVLPLLNRQVAQNDRTMFQFLSDKEQGLHHFIHTTEYQPHPGTDWYPLLTIDKLYPYFGAALAQKNQTLGELYENAISKLSQGEREGLEGALLHALILLKVIPQEVLRPTPRRLCDALNLPASKEDEVCDALRVLEDREIGHHDKLTDLFKLNLPGQTTPQELQRRIDKILREEDIDWLLTLNTKRPGPILAKRYNDLHGTGRGVNQRYVSVGELGSSASQNTWLKNSDGMILYVVATTDTERQQAIHEASQITRLNPRFIIAVPHQETDLPIQVRWVDAANKAMARAKDNPEERRWLENKANDYQKVLTQKQSDFLRPTNFLWFQDGNTHSARSDADLEGLASQVMKQVYSKTPRHQDYQHLKPNATITAIRDAIDAMLKDQVEIQPFSTKSNPPANEVLRKGAETLGLLRREGQSSNGFDRYSVIRPTNVNESEEIWKLIEMSLKMGQKWSAVAKLIMDSPFGLYPYVLALIFAAFYRINRDDITIYTRGARGRLEEKKQVTATDIVEIAKSPESFEVVYKPLPDGQRRFLKALYRTFNNGKEVMGSLRDEVETSFARWASQLPAVAESATVEDWRTLFPGSNDSELLVIQELISVTKVEVGGKRFEKILQSLPILLGLESDTQRWSNNAVDAAMQTLERAKIVSEQSGERFNVYLKERISHLFGVESYQTSLDLWQQIQQWRESHKRIDRITNNDLATTLLSEFKYANSFDDLFFNRLPSRNAIKFRDSMAQGEYYLKRLESVIRAVDVEAKRLEQASISPIPVPNPAPNGGNTKTIDSISKAPDKERETNSNKGENEGTGTREKKSGYNTAVTSTTGSGNTTTGAGTSSTTSVNVASTRDFKSALSQLRSILTGYKPNEQREILELLKKDLGL